MKTKRIYRAKVMKRWFTTNLLSCFGIYNFTMFMFFVWGLGIEFFSGEEINRGIINEAISDLTMMFIGTGFVLKFVYAILFKGMIIQPICYGSTRYEAHLGFELCNIITFILIDVSIVVMSIVCEKITGDSRYNDRMIDIILLMFIFVSIVKFLYSLYLDNTTKKKLMYGMIITVLGLLTIVCFIVVVFGCDLDELISVKYTYMCPIIAIIGLVLWITSVKILSSKKENIAVSSFEGIY